MRAAVGNRWQPAVRRTPSAAGVPGMSEHRYLDQVPSVIPPGKVLVHTHARVTRRLGLPGFRIWLASREELRMFEVCDCGWAPELGAHFRVRRQNRTHADR